MKAYQQDFAGWAEGTAQGIKDGRFEEIDREASTFPQRCEWTLAEMLGTEQG